MGAFKFLVVVRRSVSSPGVMETVRHASQKCTNPVFPSCISSVGATHRGALAASFACSLEAAIWASLPASVAVFVCPGVVGGEDSGRKHFLIARTKRRWLTERLRLRLALKLDHWPVCCPEKHHDGPAEWTSCWRRTFADCQSGESGCLGWCGGAGRGRKAVNKAEITWSPT